MPKGTGRPYTSKEKKAVKRQSARVKALRNLADKGYEAKQKGNLEDAEDLKRMRGEIVLGEPFSKDMDTLLRREMKADDRKKYKYKDRPTNKVKKKASGGSVSGKSADGIASRGKTRLAMKGYGKIG